MAEPEPGEIQAAGAVVWRAGEDGMETALVHRSRYDDWSFPKGKAFAGEHVLLTAVREVAEETGIRVTLGRRLATTQYLTSGGPKRVDYWAGRPVSPGAFIPGDEVDALSWLPLGAAAGQLSYAHDVAVLEGFAAGPADTVPVILVRHADAVGRKAWRQAGHADDVTRPLSVKGEAEAQALGQILCCYAPGRVISSGTQRCLATLGPYAARTGATVEAEPVLTIGGAAPGADGADWEPTDAARQWIAGIVTAAEPVVICAHGENLSWLLAEACAVMGAPVPSGPPLRKSAFWALQVSDRRLASAERHFAPATEDRADQGPGEEVPADGESAWLASVHAGGIPVQGCRERSLEDQQPLLDVGPAAAAVAAQPVARDDPVARHDNRDRIRRHDLADHPGRGNLGVVVEPGPARQPAVGDRLTKAHRVMQHREHCPAGARGAGKVHRHGERLPLAREVLRQFAQRGAQQRACWAGGARGVGGFRGIPVFDARYGCSRAGHRDPADRRVETAPNQFRHGP
jgi:8-oxo-(d)GTP phosphatase